MPKVIDINAFAAAHSAGAVVIDIREPYEYLSGHVPGAELIPMGYLPSRAATFPKDQPVYLICATGNRSNAMADFLARMGIDAVSVTGGTSAWARAGLEIVQGEQAYAS